MTNEDLQLYEEIRQYLDGELKGDALTAFEQRLSVDKTLAAEVKLHSNLYEIVAPEDEKIVALRKTLNQIQKPPLSDTKQTAKTIPLRKIFMAVAAIGFLGFILFTFAFPKRAYNEQLFAAHYKPEKISMTSKGETLPELTQLQNSFNEKNYPEALAKANTLLKENNTQYDVLWIKGICQLESGKHIEAVQTFQQLDMMDRRESSDKSKWYLAMVYLKMNKLQDCRKTLEQLIREKAFKYKEAEALLMKLEQ